MPYSVLLMRKLDALEPGLKDAFFLLLEELERSREESVTKSEFRELKQITAELQRTTFRLAEAQERTEQRMDRLAEAQERAEQAIARLAEAQERAEQRMDRLAESQERTEQRVDRLAAAQERTEHSLEKLAEALAATNRQVGGLSKSMAYALENEAFRKLPAYLKEHWGIEVEKRLVRRFVAGEEINVFAQALRQGEEILVVGETVLKLDDFSKLGQLDKNVAAVKERFEQPVAPLIVTHFARPEVAEKARERGVLVVQSFEWE